MASTIQFSLIREPEHLDIVDDEWAKDSLADDDIPLPEEVKKAEEVEEGQETQNEQLTWLELGLNDARID